MKVTAAGQASVSCECRGRRYCCFASNRCLQRLCEHGALLSAGETEATLSLWSWRESLTRQNFRTCRVVRGSSNKTGVKRGTSRFERLRSTSNPGNGALLYLPQPKRPTLWENRASSAEKPRENRGKAPAELFASRVESTRGRRQPAAPRYKIRPVPTRSYLLSPPPALLLLRLSSASAV